ncbi:tetratricopeptide repeat protein [Thermostaphylospora chromogena]|uniref:Tetratricopeptide repeat-containing protein n=1 Tax=Thermostaphylospora chromogena TaxID=35622 RepID=A0A1H1C058_9ACTN|nr:tetratricopeptide repeat protein [Thermostaphylospora chromogena]SDQ57582.1 Tetratricopeptide repeat-containing protein [Thermostaphylospora chromogena]
MNSVAQSFERAKTLLEMQRPADAERELRGLLAQDPQNALAHSLLALALISQGDVTGAVDAAREGVRLAPDHWFPHYAAGQVYHRVRQGDPALAAARTALSLAPEQASVWELVVRIHLLRCEWAYAADAARRGLALAPEDSDLMSLLARALNMLGEADQAREAAARAVSLDPESATAHLMYGWVMLTRGDPRQAADAFREVLRLDPNLGEARDLLVAALKERNPLNRFLNRLRLRYRGGWWMVFLLPAVPPVVALFVLIALLHWAAWVAESWTVLRLARSRATSLLFEGAEARTALICCGLAVAGVALLALGVGLGLDTVGTAGATVMALVTPVQEAVHTGAPAGRRVLYGWAVLLALTAVASVLSGTFVPALLAAYAALATVWIATGVRRLFRSGDVLP